jgi:hypothetical protein
LERPPCRERSLIALFVQQGRDRDGQKRQTPQSWSDCGVLADHSGHFARLTSYV